MKIGKVVFQTKAHLINLVQIRTHNPLDGRKLDSQRYHVIVDDIVYFEIPEETMADRQSDGPSDDEHVWPNGDTLFLK